MGFVYKITNNANGKIYIGFTSKTIQERFKTHIANALHHFNRRLYDAMNHYGYENFTIEAIEEKNSINELKQSEIFWIHFFNSTDPNIGYNMTLGGDGCDCVSYMSEEAKKKRSQTISKKLKGRKLSKEHIEKIRQGNIGKHVSEEVKQKLREIRLGKINVFKGNTCRVVDKSQLQSFLDNGYKLGQGKRSEEICRNIGLSKLGLKQKESTKQKRSESMSKLKWFNNGKEQMRSTICPDGWKVGRLKCKLSETSKMKSSHKSFHVFNNGKINITAKTCPVGFVPGRINSLKKTKKEKKTYFKTKLPCIMEI